MFEDAREFMSLKEFSSLEVCVNNTGPYLVHGKSLSKYAASCTCTRPGFSPYETACYSEAGKGSQLPDSVSSRQLLETDTTEKMVEE